MSVAIWNPILDCYMSVAIWNCHSWPLDGSNNLSGYCISNLVLVSAFGIYMCIYALVFPYIFLLVDCFKWALIGDIEKWRVHSVLWQFGMSGIHRKFYPGKTDFSLYFPISWLFWMGSHWSHWTAKSLLCALAVSNGGPISFTPPGVNLKIWAQMIFMLCFTEGLFVLHTKDLMNIFPSISLETS